MVERVPMTQEAYNKRKAQIHRALGSTWGHLQAGNDPAQLNTV